MMIVQRLSEFENRNFRWQPFSFFVCVLIDDCAEEVQVSKGSYSCCNLLLDFELASVCSSVK